MYKVEYMFYEEGLYLVDVIYDGSFVFSSFFQVFVIEGCDFFWVCVYGLGI